MVRALEVAIGRGALIIALCRSLLAAPWLVSELTVIGLLTLVGGVIGCVEAYNTASIGSSVISGIALIVAAWLLPGNVALALANATFAVLVSGRKVRPRFFENRQNHAFRFDGSPERDWRHHRDRRLDEKANHEIGLEIPDPKISTQTNFRRSVT